MLNCFFWCHSHSVRYVRDSVHKLLMDDYADPATALVAAGRHIIRHALRCC